MFFIVPDECHIWVDCRTIPGESQATAVQALERIVGTLRTEDLAVDAEVTVERQDWKWPRIIDRGIGSCSVDIRHPVVQAVAKAYTQIIERQPQYIVQNAWCETDFLINDLRIPAVNFGPGQMELAHIAQEHIDIEQFYRGIEVLALSLGLLGHPGALKESSS
jgi:acetylornithine deacetylase/succinyl-diaminopimelate desuccinylase-like protein